MHIKASEAHEITGPNFLRYLYLVRYTLRLLLASGSESALIHMQSAWFVAHMRSGSTGSIVDWETIVNHEDGDEDLRCIQLNTTRAHQQPITVLDSEGGRVLTGSKDHTLKVGSAFCCQHQPCALAVNFKIMVLSDVTPYSLVDRFKDFLWTCCSHLYGNFDTVDVSNTDKLF